MNTKLTLKLDKKIIDQAKIHAKKTGKSLSNLVENYFKHIIKNEKNINKNKYTPIVEELLGSITLKNTNIKEDYTEYLLKKYE